MDSSDLSGRTAVVTGASSGIGAAIARELAAAGVRLVLTGRSDERLSAMAADLGAAAIPGDIVDPQLPSQLLARALDLYGRCDIVVNNAGIIEVGPIPSIDVERVCAMVRVNVEAAYRVAYLFARHFLDQRRGALVNMSSVLGTKVRPTAGAYAGTKYAIEALCEGLRMELAGTPVRVICIEPGLVLTRLHDHWPIHPSKSMDIAHALQPEDVARVVRFTLSQPDHVRIPRVMIVPGEHEI